MTQNNLPNSTTSSTSQIESAASTGGATNNFNYQITKFFLNNSRLTVLLFSLLVIMGVGSTLLLKTTGFPNPELGFATIQTVYPGASSETVVKDVSRPIENAIKGVDGIDSVTSTSSNNFSILTVSMRQGVDYDVVRNKLSEAVSTVQLPDAAQDPVVNTPEISGPDVILTVAGTSLEQTYEISQRLETDLNKIQALSSVEPIAALKKKVLVNINQDQLDDSGVTLDEVNAQLSSIGETLPIISDAPLSGNSYTLNTSLNSINSLEQIRSIPFVVSSQLSQGSQLPQGQATAQIPSAQNTFRTVLLSDFAEVNFAYEFDQNNLPVFSYNQDGQAKVVTNPVILNIKAVQGTAQDQFVREIDQIIEGYEDVDLVKADRVSEIDSSRAFIVQNYTSNASNQEQVDEVVGGLIGGLLDIEGPAANLGWLLGGIQLVFLVMIAFVSWRAAIIAAISIPLSLVFSSIYLYIIGESLNTLVLFSLVLVIGLVVDPALVILESIQRKVDTGLKGKDAALAAVKDVGNGLFLATLTNIIVFAPFGLISGVIGQIFGYIPLTVIPATIGSYIVPLIFLAWLGGLILKPSKNKTSDEEQNLWGVAKGLIKLNLNILKSHPIIRTLIILTLLVIPFGVAGYYVSTGQVRVVQFASDDNGNFLTLEGSFLPGVTPQDRSRVTEQALEVVAAQTDVVQVFPFGGDFSYLVELKASEERVEQSTQLADRINDILIDRFGENSENPKFFDIKASVQQTAGSGSDYQVAIAVKTDDFEKLRAGSLAVDEVLRDTCLNSQRLVVVDEVCEGGTKLVTKVDNGFTGKENKVIEVVLDRQKLAQNQLVASSIPVQGGLVNQQLKQLFLLGDDGEAAGKIDIDGQEYDVVIDKQNADPTSLDDIRRATIVNLRGQSVRLQDIAEIRETSPKSSILRVDGETVGIVDARLVEGNNDEGSAAQVSQAIQDYFSQNDYEKTRALGLEAGDIEIYSGGASADFAKSFQELIIALVIAILLTYVVLAVFFRSLTMPLVVLYTIPLTFLGLFPGLAYFGGGQIGFLEIIGIIILIGVVENVAIFLVDSANQKITEEGWDHKRAISFGSGLRLRPVLMTTFTAVASLAPLAVLSPFYRSIAVVIMFGLLSSGFVSLITTPILFIYFRWLSKSYLSAKWYNKILFFPLFPLYIIFWAIRDGRRLKREGQAVQS